MKSVTTPFLYGDYKTAFTKATEAVKNRTPFFMLTGESGTGKTTLVKTLKSVVMNQNGVLIYTTFANSSSYGILQLIADKLHLPLRRSKPETIKLIIQTITLMSSAVYLWIDESQVMNYENFQEIKMLSEAVLDGDSLFSVFFIGQLELKNKLREPQLVSMARRISPVLILTGLTREEIYRFICHNFDKKTASKFSTEALAALCEQTKGNPAVINSVVLSCLEKYPGTNNIDFKMISFCIDSFLDF